MMVQAKYGSADLWQFAIKTRLQVLAARTMVIQTKAICNLRSAACHA
jgi:hypothetical protein